MKKITFLITSIFALFLFSCGAEPKPEEKVEAEALEDLEAIIKTDDGDIHVKLFASKTPISVANFVNFAERGYWVGSNFHRVVPNFVSQAGKHVSGERTPGFTIKNETYTENPAISDLKHNAAGKLSMARTNQLHTNGSQWYITHQATPHLDGGYTLFGEVTKGLEIAINIKVGTKIKDVVMTSDTAAIHKAYADRFTEWNAILDKKFLNLRKKEDKE